MLCPQCQMNLPPDSVFCPRCGRKVGAAAQPQSAPTPSATPSSGEPPPPLVPLNLKSLSDKDPRSAVEFTSPERARLMVCWRGIDTNLWGELVLRSDVLHFAPYSSKSALGTASFGHAMQHVFSTNEFVSIYQEAFTWCLPLARLADVRVKSRFLQVELQVRDTDGQVWSFIGANRFKDTKHLQRFRDLCLSPNQ